MEDKHKILISTIRNTLTCLLLIVVGITLMKFNAQNLGTAGMGVVGCMIGMGVGGFFYAAKGLVKIRRKPIILLSADDMGVFISTGQYNQKRIKWREIKSIIPVQKGIRYGVAIMLKTPDAYYDSLTKLERKFARQNKQYFGSPAAIQTHNCTVHRVEIADELNKRWSKTQRAASQQKSQPQKSQQQKQKPRR